MASIARTPPRCGELLGMQIHLLRKNTQSGIKVAFGKNAANRATVMLRPCLRKRHAICKRGLSLIERVTSPIHIGYARLLLYGTLVTEFMLATWRRAPLRWESIGVYRLFNNTSLNP
jgi:hypothetical protein